MARTRPKSNTRNQHQYDDLHPWNQPAHSHGTTTPTPVLTRAETRKVAHAWPKSNTRSQRPFSLVDLGATRATHRGAQALTAAGNFGPEGAQGRIILLAQAVQAKARAGRLASALRARGGTRGLAGGPGVAARGLPSAAFPVGSLRCPREGPVAQPRATEASGAPQEGFLAQRFQLGALGACARASLRSPPPQQPLWPLEGGPSAAFPAGSLGRPQDGLVAQPPGDGGLWGLSGQERGPPRGFDRLH